MFSLLKKASDSLLSAIGVKKSEDASGVLDYSDPNVTTPVVIKASPKKPAAKKAAKKKKAATKKS